jgi:hypothetical protein
MTKKNKAVKITAFVLLGVSQIPWLYTLIMSIYSIFDGIWFMTGKAYGPSAFLLTWIGYLSNAFPVYIGAVGLTAASIITAIIAINKDKKQRENSNAKEI